jgi:hypothetical protein
MIGISFQRALMAQARELGDKAMRNLARLFGKKLSEGMTTPPVAHLAANLVGFLFRRY